MQDQERQLLMYMLVWLSISKLQKNLHLSPYKLYNHWKKTQQPRHIAFYLSNASRFQFESTDDITSMIDKTSSLFNIKVLKSLVNRFGNDNDRITVAL